MVTRVTRGRSFRMIICKRPTPPDDHLQKAGPNNNISNNNNNNRGDRGDGTEGGEEGREEILAGGHTDGQTN